MPDFLLWWGRGRETGGVFLSSFCLTAFVYSPLMKPTNVSKQRYRPVTRYTSQSSVLGNHFPFALGQPMSVLNPVCSSYSHQLSCSFISLAHWVSPYFLGENFLEEWMRDEGLKWSVQRVAAAAVTKSRNTSVSSEAEWETPYPCYLSNPSDARCSWPWVTGANHEFTMGLCLEFWMCVQTFIVLFSLEKLDIFLSRFPWGRGGCSQLVKTRNTNPSQLEVLDTAAVQRAWVTLLIMPEHPLSPILLLVLNFFLK